MLHTDEDKKKTGKRHIIYGNPKQQNCPLSLMALGQKTQLSWPILTITGTTQRHFHVVSSDTTPEVITPVSE